MSLTDKNSELKPPPRGLTAYERLKRQRLRYDFTKRMLGSIGVANTLKTIYSRIAKAKAETALVTKPTGLKHPLHLTTTPSDTWSYDEVFQRQVYALPEDLAKNINGKAIVDIGAYIGLASAYFASHYPDSPVIAIEPHPRNQAYLSINAARYGDQIHVIPGAVTPTQQPIGMQIFGNNEADYMANCFDSESGSSQPTNVNAITPADILLTLGEREVGILKVDIEGAERALFLAPEIDPLLQRTYILMIETHEAFMQGSELAVREAIERNNFVAVGANDGHTFIYVNPNLSTVRALSYQM